MALAGVVDWETVGAEDTEEVLQAGDDCSDWSNIIALTYEISFRSADCVMLSFLVLKW